MKIKNNLSFFLVLTVSSFLILSCGKIQNPDEGLKFRLELKDLSLSQLKHFKYVEIVRNSGAYTKQYGDTIIVYEYNNGSFIRRHTVFKYNGSSPQGYEKLLKAMGFIIVKSPNITHGGAFIVRDLKYNKNYYVTLTQQHSLDISYPDTIK